MPNKMKCCVNSCENHTKTTLKHQEITFHAVPKNTSVRLKWSNLLGKLADLKQRSVICSDHFVEDDFCYTKAGARNLRRDAVPHLSITKPDEAAAFKVCRICLSVDRKMYDLEQFGLQDSYKHLTGLLMDPGLPRVVCFECGHRLRAVNVFRNKALKAHNLLTDIFITCTTKYLTLHQVKSIDRSSNKLKSSLIQTIYKQTDYDYQLKDSLIIKSESNNDNNSYNDKDNEINSDEKELNDNNDNDNENNDIDNIDNGLNDTDNEDHNDKDNLPIIEVEIIKDETNEIYFNEYENGFESDDDRKLSEIYVEKPKPRLKLKKKKEKVEKKVKVKEKRKDDSENDPSTTMNKYKNTYIKRRRTTEGPDEALFTITTMTYDEQIAEVELRQDSNSYKNSPYRCTVCYRGFLLKDRYDAHIVRHSEQCGAFECFICKTRSKSARALRKHLTAQHTEKFSCKGCPFTTRNRGVAREHEKWHAGAKYQCPHCPSEFDKITTYMGHIRIKHVSDFVCPLCGYTFVSQKGIDVHKKKKHRLEDDTIPEDGPYCSVCEVKFITEEAHSRHLKLSSRHMSEDDPNRLRNDSQSMNTGVGAARAVRRIERRPVVHERARGDLDAPPPPGPVTCEQCGAQLRDLRLYAQHFRRAHPDKNRTKYPAMKTPCMCEQCGRIFQSMALLKDHMWVHTGEKRFKCSRCPKSFTQKTNLVFHERVHSATRPTYECPLCGKHFAFFNNRRRHMFIHTGLKPFKCDTCGKCFTTQGEQRAHVEHVHMKKPWPKRSRRRDDGWQDKCED